MSERETEAEKHLRHCIHAALGERGLRATPQAMKATVESFREVSPNIVGDSDTVLAGLLLAGSHAVDIIETAGVSVGDVLESIEEHFDVSSIIDDPDHFGRETLWPSRPEECVANFFSDCTAAGYAVRLAAQDGQMLETEHLLEAALTPRSGELRVPRIAHAHQRKDSTPVDRVLHEEMARVLVDLIGVFSINPLKTVQSRRRPLDRKEKLTILDDASWDGLAEYDLGVFAFACVDAWFQRREIITRPPEKCARLVTIASGLHLAPAAFLNAGGDFATLGTQMALVRRIYPEREFAGLALLEREGRIFVGQYTHRNVLSVESDWSKSPRMQAVSLQALRPVSLLTNTVIQEFESLLSQRDVEEMKLQRFFEHYPEVLESLGYASVSPHVALFDPNGDKLVPDFLLEMPGQLGFDILDLKLPSARLMARQPYVRISSELTKALAQLRQYRKFFDQPSNRETFTRTYGLIPFDPKLIVVIGRSTQFRSATERLELTRQIPGVRILTYDDVIEYGRSRILNL